MDQEDVAKLTVCARESVDSGRYKLWASLEEAPQYFVCSSFTQWLYLQAGRRIPRWAFQQFESCVELRPVHEAVPGDLVFVRAHYSRSSICPVLEIGHVGFVTCEKTVIHASYRSGLVTEESFLRFFSYVSSVMCVGVPTECFENTARHAHFWKKDGSLSNKNKMGNL